VPLFVEHYPPDATGRREEIFDLVVVVRQYPSVDTQESPDLAHRSKYGGTIARRFLNQQIATTLAWSVGTER
jgi:hypothetical protein